MIKHANEEGLTHWKKTLQRQRELNTRTDPSGFGRGSGQSTAATQFAWMANADPADQDRDSRDASDDDDDATVVPEPNGHHYSGLSGTTLASSRNGSVTSLRSRSATNENMPPPPPYAAAAAFISRGAQQTPPARFPLPGHTPPLTLNTNPVIQNLANSPERSNESYFSPIETPMMSSRSSSASGQAYPFPRYPTPSYYEDNSHFSAPSMSRSSSREGAGAAAAAAAAQAAQAAHAQAQAQAQYTAFQSNGAAFQNGQRLQRPSLPGMGASAPVVSALTQQSRMRSASSPNIHHLPNPSQLSRVSPGGGGVIPPVPSLPPSLPGPYIPYSGGPAVVSRGQNGSPTSPILPGQRSETPTAPDLNGVLGTPVNGGISTAKSQVKVKVHYNNDKFVLIVPYSIAYAQLIDRIERKVEFCGALPASPIRVRYQDEDGDFISMNSDDDVQMAFDVGCEGAIKDATGACGTVTLYVQVG